jgi:heptaprenyl diphosphate synthase
MPKLLSFGELADNRTDIVIPHPHVSVPTKMTKTHTFASPDDVKSARRVLVWARNYLMRDHELVNRPYPPQTICPFVEASMKANCFYMAFHNEVNGSDVTAIAELILSYVNPFNEAPPLGQRERILKALVIVFPNIEERFLTALDSCHRMIKPDIVKLGMMIGQFHRKCRELAIHNPRWDEISKSPISLMAMRYMALHDIMFLDRNEEEFRVYNDKFGYRFVQQGKLLASYQKHLIPYYNRAISTFGCEMES